MKKKINQYIATWKNRGYSDDIPDEVPHVLMKLNLAPSYKAIAVTILKNDHNCTSLGYSSPKSEWYNFYKREELIQRGVIEEPKVIQMELL